MKFKGLTLGVLLGAAIAVVSVTGCGSDDTSGGTAASPVTGGPAQTGTLYDRLGKKAGITAAIDAIVTAELKDPEVASYFFFQGKTPLGDHPSKEQIGACFVQLLANAAGGPEKYPAASPTETAGFTCRDMNKSHATLGITSGTFDKFMNIAAGVLKGFKDPAGKQAISDADIGTIAGVLTATKSAVAQDTKRPSGNFVPPPGG